MAVNIEDGWHKQLMDLDSFEEVSAPMDANNPPEKSSIPQVAGSVSNFPKIADVHMTNEEVNACWKKARKEGGDKYKVQKMALSLIAELSYQKQKQIQETEAQMVKKAKRDRVDSPAKRKVVKRKVVKKAPSSKQASSSGMIRLEEEELVEEFAGIEVTVKYGDFSTSTLAGMLIDDPATVIMRIDGEHQDKLLAMTGIKKSTIVDIDIYNNETSKFSNRKVIADPIRFKDNGAIYIIFVCVPDGT